MARGQDAAVGGLSRDTAERVTDPGWWPTKGTAARSEYAGSDSCASCHGGIAELQKQTPMFKAASRAAETSILQKHRDMRYLENRLSYAMVRRDGGTDLSVKSGSETISAPVAWAMGDGEIGQTYLLKQNGTYLEGRLSYFTSLTGLDVTPGQSADPSSTLEKSLGEPLDPVAAARCFGCHTTASTVSGVFDPEHATPGVSCEACHGPSAEHVKTLRQGNDTRAAPLNPQKLSPVESVDFCGACHRTPVDVAVHMSEHLGPISIRFQPYRLERSLCWGASGDPRITCIACHDPHKPLVKDTASYDSRCLQCHAETGRQAKEDQASPCTVAARDCASCHMPKYTLEAAHASFTDHYIHIVRPGSGFRE